jgi:hypothetical protein
MAEGGHRLQNTLKSHHHRGTEKEEKGIMEEWNIGMLDQKLNRQNPLFDHSIIAIFKSFSLCPLCLCGEKIYGKRVGF